MTCCVCNGSDSKQNEGTDWQLNPINSLFSAEPVMGTYLDRPLSIKAVNTTSSILLLEDGIPTRGYQCHPTRLVDHHCFANTPRCLIQQCIKKMAVEINTCTVYIVIVTHKTRTHSPTLIAPSRCIPLPEHGPTHSIQTIISNMHFVLVTNQQNYIFGMLIK